jgi:hypothetical protein
MKKIINYNRSRIYYTGKIEQLKEYLFCLAHGIPTHKNEIIESAKNLEEITSIDFENNNIHTMSEKLYFNREKILYASRDNWFFRSIIKTTKNADKLFLTRNPRWKINKKVIRENNLLKDLGENLLI